MAIAPSKLGQFVLEAGPSDPVLAARLREFGLVNPDTSDAELFAVFQMVRDEDSALDEEERLFNSPHERVRVFLAPYLTAKGCKWAEPFESLKLSD